jgi:hypothetical protein
MEYILRYNLKPGRTLEYQRWLRKRAGAQDHQRGWSYAGTYYDMFGYGDYDYETRWHCDDECGPSPPPLEGGIENAPGDHLPFVEACEISLMRSLRRRSLGAA